LFRATVDPDFGPIYYKLKGASAFPAGEVLDTDRVFTRGSGEGWPTDADV
jgi:phenylalanine-4-hydroxylase